MAGDLFIVQSDSHEWRRMWTVLAEDPINAKQADPFEAYNEQYHEAWQYMGSVTEYGLTRHEFRHRWHPETNKREYRHIYLDPDKRVDPQAARLEQERKIFAQPYPWR